MASAASLTPCTPPGYGVLVDWVPAHFAGRMGAGQVRRHALYETPTRVAANNSTGHPGVRLRPHRGAQLLVANALYWLEVPHRRAAGGCRATPCSTWIIPPGRAWLTYVHGGRENLDAVTFLQEMNATVYRKPPWRDHDRRGEPSVALASTRHPPRRLGFGFKWNVGWMHDTLDYIGRDPVDRGLHRDTEREKRRAVPARTTARYKKSADEPLRPCTQRASMAPRRSRSTRSRRAGSPHLPDGGIHRCQMFQIEGRPQLLDRRRVPHGFELGPAPSSKRAAAQRIRHHQDVGEQNRGIETIALPGCMVASVASSGV